jgi:hypothetical protein
LVVGSVAVMQARGASKEAELRKTSQPVDGRGDAFGSRRGNPGVE